MADAFDAAWDSETPSFDAAWDSTPEPVSKSQPFTSAAALATQNAFGGVDEPSMASNFFSNISSPDWWLTRGNGERITAKQAIAGPLTTALNGLTFGQGDEIISGGTSALDALTGSPETYSDRLNEVRGAKKDFKNAAPGTALGIEIASGLKTPIFSTLKKGDGAIKTGLKMGAEGGALSALYGFGEGEGGFGNRLESATEAAKTGAALGGALGFAGKGAYNLANELSGTTKDWARKLTLNAFGGNQSSIKQAFERSPELADEAGNLLNPLSDSIESFRAQGGGKRGMDGGVLLQDLEEQSAKFGNELRERLATASEQQADTIIPEFTNTAKYIEKLPGAVKQEAKDLAGDLISKTMNNTDGTLLSLQAEKQGLGPLIKDSAFGTNANPVKTNILKYIKSDLKRTIEDGYAQVTGESGDVIANLNKELGKRENLYPLFERIRNSDEARTILGSGLQTLRTSGGVGQTLIAGAAAGGTLGPVAGGAAVLGNLYLQTPQGKNALANGLKRFSSLSRVTGKALAPINAIPSKVLAPLSVKQKKEQRAKPPVRDAFSDLFDSTLAKPEKSSLASLYSEDSDMDIDVKQLAKKVVQQESGGKADAVSNKNAIGLMQVLPSTAAEIAKKLNIKDPDLKDPETNVKIGTEYLKQLIKQFDGDVELALTAYHSGPGRVEKLLKQTGGNSLDDILPLLGPVGKKYARQVLARKA